MSSYYIEELTETVENLIRTNREDDWWDFKECHHDDKAAMLHDIICLANNRADRDAYLIIGVRDKTFEIIGVENDPNRKNQQNIVDFLRTKNFAGQLRPRVEVHTIWLDSHEVDVLIIKNSTDTPYYLIDNYTDNKVNSDTSKKGKTVQAYYIYTRVLDNNTPINKSADVRDIEYLWKKRFGLLQTPLDQVKILLKSPEQWAEEDSRYYHKLFPQFTISIEYEEDEDGSTKEGHPEFYHYLQTDTSTQYGRLKVYHYTTQLFSCQVTELDGHRMTAPCPEWGFIQYRSYGDPDISFKFYTTSDLYYILLRFLETKIGDDNGYEAQIATRKLLDVVLLFTDHNEVEDFKEYVSRHYGMYDDLVSKERKPYISDPSEKVVEVETKRIRDGWVLKKMQENWREFVKANRD